MWRSAKQRHVAQSTEKAEFNALYETVDRMLYLLAFYHELRWRVGATVHSDSDNVIKLLRRPHPRPAENHLALELRQLQRRIALEPREFYRLGLSAYAMEGLLEYFPQNPIQLEFCKGEGNPADCLTKPSDVVRKLVDPFLSSVAARQFSLPGAVATGATLNGDNW